jgi:copper chaperone
MRMFEFHVEDMTCGHCVSTITKAVKDADPKAVVDIDLKSHLVRISGTSTSKEIAEVIRDAGYTPVEKGGH